MTTFITYLSKKHINYEYNHHSNGFELYNLPAELYPPIFSYLSWKEAIHYLASPFCHTSQLYLQQNGDMLWFSLVKQGPWTIPLNYRPSVHPQQLAKQLYYLHNNWNNLDMKSMIEQIQIYPNFPSLLYTCLSKIWELAEKEAERIQLGQLYGIKNIVQLMQTYPNDAMIQRRACRALVTAARPLGGSEGSAYKGGCTSTARQIGEEGGIVYVLKAMQQHVNDAEVQSMACWSLVNISLVTEQKKQVLELNGMEMILQAMRLHRYNREVQFRALFALVNLVISDETLRTMPEDTLELILISIETYPKDEGLISRACLVLQNLSINAENLLRLKTQHGMERILRNVLIQHYDHPQEQQDSSSLLTAIINSLLSKLQLSIPMHSTSLQIIHP